MDIIEHIVPILLGIGLSAAVGLRIFLPFFILSLTAYLGDFSLASGFEWLGSLPALLLLGTATLLEIAAYYIPWFDNLLDTVATPAAFICGSLMMGATLVDMEPLVKWSLAIIAGGGAATTIKAGAAATRLTSSLSTGGLGNPIVSTAETTGATVLSITSILIPFVSFLILILLIYLTWRMLFKRRSKKNI